MQAENRSARLRLHDILKAIAGIRETVAGLGYEHYLTVWWIKHASERGIEIISEASRHIPDALKEAAPEVPWREIAGIGNVLRHGYDTVSDHVVWDIIINHLDPLEAAVQRLLKETEALEDPIRPDP
jgi:uncharacterized protein with HEPN domain